MNNKLFDFCPNLCSQGKAPNPSTTLGANTPRALHEACGIVGVFSVKDAAQMVALGLHSLQHRGQESAGITSCKNGKLYTHKALGLVANVFGNKETNCLPGNMAIGHVLYSTGGFKHFFNAQPLVGKYSNGELAIGHNGSLSKSKDLQNMLLNNGALIQTQSDSELFLHLIAQEQAKSDTELATVLSKAGAAFALVMLFPDKLVAARDPWGFRPLALGKLDDGFVVASESCAFDQMGATYIREIEAGEMLTITAGGLRSTKIKNNLQQEARCLLELIYFSRPDSLIFGQNPHLFRKKSGQLLAREHPADVDIVVAIPDSGLSAAMGFAEELNTPLDRGLIRNHYIGRSFIAPGQESRAAMVRMKNNVVQEVVKGKRVALLDDSLIRGTTTAALGKELRDAGATEVHLRIACPPTMHPCTYGVDFPSYDELMAHKHSKKEMQSILNMDSLEFLSIENLKAILEPQRHHYCTACWSGNYPT